MLHTGCDSSSSSSNPLGMFVMVVDIFSNSNNGSSSCLRTVPTTRVGVSMWRKLRRLLIPWVMVDHSSINVGNSGIKGISSSNSNNCAGSLSGSDRINICRPRRSAL